MGDGEKRKAFLKGYEEGLKAAWREIGSLTTRGYSSTELSVLAKSKLAVLYRDVEAMEGRMIEEEGIPVVGGGELSVRNDIGRRGVYLVREPKAERVFSLFSDLLQTNARGLCITRIHPDDLRSRYRIEGAGFIWLSKSAGGTAKGMAVAEPSALVDIATAISDFASDGGNAAVVLEGLEYMISQNGFASIMRFLQKVNEKITLNDSYLLISANPAAMKEQEYRLLAKEVAAENGSPMWSLKAYRCNEPSARNSNATMNRFARSPPRRIWGKFSNPTPIVEKATPNIVMKSRRGKVVEDPCPVGCDAISKRPRKSATHPTRTMRTPQTRNASSVMLGRVRSIPVVEGREDHLVSVVPLPGNRVPKAFMAYAANRPFRSRSLV